MRWVEHIARMERREILRKPCLKILKGIDHLEELVVAGRIILEWMLEK